MTLIHIWSILLPCVTHKWGAQVVPGVFEWPLSERTPPGFKDADPVNKMMSLQVDDVFRLVEMTLLLAVITPLSIRWMQQYWHLGIQVHRFVNVLYFVDIVRRHSHPHSWVLNTPVFAIWILDKVYSMYWRRINEPNYIYEKISNDYIVLYWQNEHEISRNLAVKEIMGVGSNYFLKLYPSSWLEPRHPFTTFTSRSGNCDHLLIDNDVGAKLQNKKKWNSGAVIRLFHNDRKIQIGSKLESRSHTKRISKAFEEEHDSSMKKPPVLEMWGPFQGDMTEMIPRTLFDKSSLFGCSSACCGIVDGMSTRHLVLVGSGSAVNFMIDFMSYLEQVKESIEAQRTDRLSCILLYSTRDVALYNWSVRAISVLQNRFQFSFSDHGDDDNGVIKKRVPLDVKIIMSCTATSSSANQLEFSLKDFNELLVSSNDSNDGDDKYSSSLTYDREGLPPSLSTSSSSTSLSSSSSSNGEECSSSTSSSVTFLDGRIDYVKEIPENSVVFCQGSMQIQNAVKSACCKKKHVRVHLD